MKMKVKATITFEWEEDTENWPGTKPSTKEELLRCMKEYASEDYSYFLECPITSVAFAEVP